jgi:hypothetical protein
VSSLGLSTSLKRRCAARPSRPAAYPLVRTTLLLATALAVVGYVLFPTAPPRLSDIGIVDTVSGGHVDLDKGVVSSLYALIVGVTLARYARHVVTRGAGFAYPPFVLLMIVATGNHFFVDAAAGAAVAGVAFLAARPLTEPATDTEGRH